MPRVRIRLSTLALFIVIAGLSAALFVERRREGALSARVQLLERELASFRQLFKPFPAPIAPREGPGNPGP